MPQPPPERRRGTRQKPGRGSEPTWVTLEKVRGHSGEIRAKVVDFSESGLGVHLPYWLRDNEIVIIKGLAGASGTQDKVKARVARCVITDGGYVAGLAYEDGYHPPAQKPTQTLPDYYELLQMSPSADPDVIHRVYRLLAQRYHPDNAVTGDEGTFREISEAYKVLCDPEKRAAYDVHVQFYRQERWRIFDNKEAAVGKMAEKSKRQGILELLYTARRNQPTSPTLNLHELESLLGCPREHLECSLWYLKENGLVVRSDNGRFAVTARGMDYAEEHEITEISKNRLLSVAQETTGAPH